MPCLMPILEEKWYQQSTCWNSGGSCEEAYSSIALWSCKSPFQCRLSISIMHHWRDAVEKFWDLLAIISLLGSKGSPRITVLVGSVFKPPMTEARLCKSWTGCWETRKSKPGMNFKGRWSNPPNDLTIWLLVTEVIIVTVSFNWLSYGWLFYRYEDVRWEFPLGRLFELHVIISPKYFVTKTAFFDWMKS